MRLERTAQIWGITGNLGGGKTLSAVELAVRCIANDYFVCTNIDLHLDVLSAEIGDRCRSLYMRLDLEAATRSVGDDDLSYWDTLPCGDPRGSGGSRRVIVILDEVAEWFDQFSGTSSVVRQFLSWLRHSSKRGQDVVLVVQRKEFLAKSLRILVARWIWVEDLAVWRLPHFRIRLPFCSGLVMRYVSDRLGNSIQPLEFSKKSRWGRYYCTSQLLAGTMSMPYEIPPSDNIRTSRSPLACTLSWILVLVWAVSRAI